MPDPMTGFYEGPPRAERVEVITSVQRRRRWSTEEKVRIVEETYLPIAAGRKRRAPWPGNRSTFSWRGLRKGIRLGDALYPQEYFGAFVSAPGSVFDAEVLAHIGAL